MEFEAVPIIAVAIILYALSEILKCTLLKNKDELKAVLPYFCAIFGAIIGAVVFCIKPELLGCMSILDAIVNGAASGLVATGANQIYKQFAKLMAVARSDKEKIEEEVACMSDEEKKEYLLDKTADVACAVIDKVKEAQENATHD